MTFIHNYFVGLLFILETGVVTWQGRAMAERIETRLLKKCKLEEKVQISIFLKYNI